MSKGGIEALRHVPNCSRTTRFAANNNHDCQGCQVFKKDMQCSSDKCLECLQEAQLGNDSHTASDSSSMSSSPEQRIFSTRTWKQRKHTSSRRTATFAGTFECTPIVPNCPCPEKHVQYVCLCLLYGRAGSARSERRLENPHAWSQSELCKSDFLHCPTHTWMPSTRLDACNDKNPRKG